MKQRYQLTDDELKRLFEAAKPTPVMFLSGGQPMFDSPQENANRVWKDLGKTHGFVWDTAEPAGTDQHFIMAESAQPSTDKP